MDYIINELFCLFDADDIQHDFSLLGLYARLTPYSERVMNTTFQVPEILDNILEHVNSEDYDRHNLYSCLLVNRQFHAQATRLLYRNLSFRARPNKKRLEAEDNLCNELCQRPALALNVRSLFLDITETSHETPSMPFDARITPVLRSLRNLQRIEVYTSTLRKSLPMLTALPRILNNIESRADVSFVFDHDFCPFPVDIQECVYPILCINKRLPVKSLNLRACGFPRTLRFLSQFRQLNSLSLRGYSTIREDVGGEDLDIIFKEVPLSKLEVHGGYMRHSFPSTLESLALEDRL